MSADIPFPAQASLAGLLQWAKTLVSTLRRQHSEVQTVVISVEEDGAATLEAAANYATDVQASITAAGGFAQDVYDQYAAAAAAQQAQLASHYLTEAANRVEQQTRITEDEVSAQRTDTLAAYLEGSGATIETIETAVANGDTAIATRIDNVQSQANGNSASVSSLTTSVNGISARWGVSVNINGHVAGLVQLDGSASGSTFVVVADKFIVSHPSSSGTLITPFVVGLVAGVSTVAINGNLLVDGSILAQHIGAGEVTAGKIDVATLDAITADVGELTAGVLRSADSKFIIDLDNKTITITT